MEVYSDLKTTKPQIAQCVRCKGIVYSCWVDGLQTVADVIALDELNHRVASIAHQWTYDVILGTDGTPRRLRKNKGQYGPHKAVREHSCKLVGVRILEGGEIPKVPARVTSSETPKDIARA